MCIRDSRTEEGKHHGLTFNLLTDREACRDYMSLRRDTKLFPLMSGTRRGIFISSWNLTVKCGKGCGSHVAHQSSMQSLKTQGGGNTQKLQWCGCEPTAVNYLFSCWRDYQKNRRRRRRRRESWSSLPVNKALESRIVEGRRREMSNFRRFFRIE